MAYLACAAAGLGLLYVAVIPVLAPPLAFVSASPAFAAGFMLLTSVGAVNLLTDSVFIAARKSGYNALVDGGIGGLSKLVFAVVLAGTGSYGLFSAVRRDPRVRRGRQDRRNAWGRRGRRDGRGRRDRWGRTRSLISSSRAAGADGDQPGLTLDDVHVRQVRRPTWYTRSVTTVITAKQDLPARARLP